VTRPESRYVEKKAYLSRYAHERLLAQRESPDRVNAEFSDEWFRKVKEELPRFVPFLAEACGVEFRGRILEIGAGTGGLTSYVLPLLPRGRSTYAFTDLSGAFFNKAEQKFGEFPF